MFVGECLPLIRETQRSACTIVALPSLRSATFDVGSGHPTSVEPWSLSAVGAEHGLPCKPLARINAAAAFKAVALELHATSRRPSLHAYATDDHGKACKIYVNESK
jgi:hypothetical protein